MDKETEMVFAFSTKQILNILVIGQMIEKMERVYANIS